MSTQLTETQYNKIMDVLKVEKRTDIQVKKTDKTDYIQDICLGLLAHNETALAAKINQCLQ